MSDNSKIEWTDATWNPITGCSVTSPGCTNCYAMKLAGTRLKHHESRIGLTDDSKAGPVWNGKVRLNEQWLDQPLRWRNPRMIFVCAHGDLFHENVPDEWIDQVFAIMALAPQHIFQVLTKRSERMRDYLDSHRQTPVWDKVFDLVDQWHDGEGIMDGIRLSVIRSCAEEPGDPISPALAAHGATWGGEKPWPLKNVWLGVSVEDQQRADERIPHLLDTPAAVRWLSCEPRPRTNAPQGPQMVPGGASLMRQPPKIEIDRRGIKIGGKRIPIVSDAEGEKADAVVCGSPRDPTPFINNVETECAWCNAAIIHRPNAPKSPPKICIPCAIRTRQ